MGERRYSWGAKVRVAAEATPTGCPQTETRCWNCGLVAITVHPPHGLAWKAWRTADNPQQFTSDVTPRCEARATAVAAQ